MGGHQGSNVDIICMRGLGPPITVGLQCVSLSVLLTHYLKWLHYILIYTCILHRNNLQFYFPFWHICTIVLSWQLQLVLWHNAD